MNPLLVSLSFSFFTTTENQDINLVSVLIVNNQKILDKIFRHKFMSITHLHSNLKKKKLAKY